MANTEKIYRIDVAYYYSDEDMQDIVISAIEGGIGYWACLDNTTEAWKDKPKDVPVSEWAYEILKKGWKLEFTDEEDDEAKYEIDWDSFVIGIQSAISGHVWDGDIDSVDSIIADCIFQYAIFGEVVYG